MRALARLITPGLVLFCQRPHDHRARSAELSAPFSSKRQAAQEVLADLVAAGWKVNLSKSFGHCRERPPVKRCVALGMVIDTERGTFAADLTLESTQDLILSLTWRS